MRTRIVAIGMMLVLVGLLLAGCGASQEELDAEAAEAARTAAEEEAAEAEAEAEATRIAAEEEAVAGEALPEETVTAGVYTNEEFGFSLTYDPNIFPNVSEDEWGWTAADALYGAAAISASWTTEVVEGESFVETYGSSLTESGNTDFVVVSETDVTTPDGTTVQRVEYTVNWDGLWPSGMTIYVTERDGLYLYVSVMGRVNDQPGNDAILSTWTFE